MFNLSKSKHINLIRVYQKSKVIYDEISAVKKRKKKNKLFKFFKYFSISILTLFLIGIVGSAAYILSLEQIFCSIAKSEDNFKQNNSVMAGFVKKQDWADEIKNIAGDYLMVIDNNIVDSEADIIINKSINYRVDQSINGLFVDLQIDYACNGQPDLDNTGYKVYVKVYAPSGSRMIKAEINNISIQKDELKVSNKLGKTVFNVFLSIKPSEIKNLYFYYKLPDDIDNSVKNGFYELYVQKQPKSEANMLTVDLNFINKVKSYKPTGFYVYRMGDNRVRWESNLDVDKTFSVGF